MQNKSGIRPLEYKVVMLPDPVEQKTKGGVILPDQAIERKEAETTRGTIVAISPLAFNYDNFPPELAPKAGDRVVTGRYTGKVFQGADGKTYRLLNDKDILGVETST